jgi:precorrin-6B methylase 2
VAEICQCIFNRIKSGGVMVVAAVTLETRAVLTALLPEYLEEMVEIGVSRAKELAQYHLLAAENPVCLYCFQKPWGKN